MRETQEILEIRATLGKDATHAIHASPETHETQEKRGTLEILELHPLHAHRTMQWRTTLILLQEEHMDPPLKVPTDQDETVRRTLARDRQHLVTQAIPHIQVLTPVIQDQELLQEPMPERAHHLTLMDPMQWRESSLGHLPTSAAGATSSAGGSAGEMALPLTRRASHAYGSENQLEEDRVGAPEGREKAPSYVAAHPGPRRSDPTPYGAASRSMDSEYGALLPGYGLQGSHAYAMAVAAASYYHGHAPPGYPVEEYPPPLPGHPSAHGHAGQQELGSKQDDKAAMSQSGPAKASRSAVSASASLGGQAKSMSVQAVPEHQKVSAA
ncbi:hypothetical protein BGW39_011356 [Mortierella sp. 14UC]|nr:hypothetical protein BGW39_011356 [Mortierella sp. 14UC]